MLGISHVCGVDGPLGPLGHASDRWRRSGRGRTCLGRGVLRTYSTVRSSAEELKKELRDAECRRRRRRNAGGGGGKRRAGEELWSWKQTSDLEYCCPVLFYSHRLSFEAIFRFILNLFQE
jgi:hypothetical protein